MILILLFVVNCLKYNTTHTTILKTCGYLWQIQWHQSTRLLQSTNTLVLNGLKHFPIPSLSMSRIWHNSNFYVINFNKHWASIPYHLQIAIVAKTKLNINVLIFSDIIITVIPKCLNGKNHENGWTMNETYPDKIIM